MSDDKLSKQQNDAIRVIFDTLISLPWIDRRAVFEAIEYNDTFCPHCGFGEVETPNERCYCQNDE
jgi:hypothetical protein